MGERNVQEIENMRINIWWGILTRKENLLIQERNWCQICVIKCHDWITLHCKETKKIACVEVGYNGQNILFIGFSKNWALIHGLKAEFNSLCLGQDFPGMLMYSIKIYKSWPKKQRFCFCWDNFSIVFIRFWFLRKNSLKELILLHLTAFKVS